MTITNKQVCEQCGAPSARIYAYWPATLCQACAAERVANEKAAGAAQDALAVDTADEPSEAVATPEATTEAVDVDAKAKQLVDAIAAKATRPLVAQDQHCGEPVSFADAQATAAVEAMTEDARKRQERRQRAAQRVAEYHRILPLQLALVRRVMFSGDRLGARRQVMTVFESYVRVRHGQQTGILTDYRPVSRILSDLHRREGLTDAELLELLDTWHRLELATDPDHESITTAIGLAIRRLGRIADEKMGRPYLDDRKGQRAARAIGAYRKSPQVCSGCGAFSESAEPGADLEIGWQDAEATEEAVTA